MIARPFTATVLAAALAGVASGCSGSDADLSGEWRGTCSIGADGSFTVLDLRLRDVAPRDDAMATNTEGEWTVFTGGSDIGEDGKPTKNAPLLILRCESSGDCTNQGDPYELGQTLFNLRPSATFADEVVMKGFPGDDEPHVFTGVCQLTRGGIVRTGEFELERI